MPFIEMLEYSARAHPAVDVQARARRIGVGSRQADAGIATRVSGHPKPVELPPEQQRRFLFNAYREFVERASRMTPLAIVLEDLHWADEPTLLLLQHLAQTVPTVPLLVLGTYRDVELDVDASFRQDARNPRSSTAGHSHGPAATADRRCGVDAVVRSVARRRLRR